MKTILRNLFYTLKRFRTASVLNLLGLSTAFAAFILIMMKVSYEYNFDTCYPDSDRIAVLNLSVDHHPNELIVLPRPFVEGVIEETPAIECGAFFNCSQLCRTYLNRCQATPVHLRTCYRSKPRFCPNTRHGIHNRK